MEAFGNILVFHPAAIGDAMLASPVAATLKLNFPAAKVTYWTHAELRPILLSLCPSIDEIIDYDRKASIFELAKTFTDFKADLFVDLANNTKSKLMTLISRRTKIFRYEKQAALARPIRHAAENFLDTIRPICPQLPGFPFPTIFPEGLAEEVVERLLAERGLPNSPIIGIVPGVGKHRPHRAWIYESWVYLLQHIGRWSPHVPALIGGSDEVKLCAELEAAVGTPCLNLAGRLSLPETAALLKHCRVVVSGDTGPAHIAVAVGTPVIGLYGPTFPERSGPYGCLDMVLDQSESCACHDEKHCRFANPHDSGQCMARIMLVDVVERLQQFLQLPPSDQGPPSE
jgi:ADP-heptose:LPS heptosyltransferase